MSISEEIRASAAAHSDLGPGYDRAVAEGLVERIGEEIDRVDARLGNQPLNTAPRRRQRRPHDPAADPGQLGFAHVVRGHQRRLRAPALRVLALSARRVLAPM
ncbi:MAG TPA: hypothetical protein VN969_27280 [Streptosporangiaceae bacterium]|nr:hypothetical protein [Streptosporangiaceae bacterium]